MNKDPSSKNAKSRLPAKGIDPRLYEFGQNFTEAAISSEDTGSKSSYANTPIADTHKPPKEKKSELQASKFRNRVNSPNEEQSNPKTSSLPSEPKKEEIWPLEMKKEDPWEVDVKRESKPSDEGNKFWPVDDKRTDESLTGTKKESGRNFEAKKEQLWSLEQKSVERKLGSSLKKEDELWAPYPNIGERKTATSFKKEDDIWIPTMKSTEANELNNEKNLDLNKLNELLEEMESEEKGKIKPKSEEQLENMILEEYGKV